MTASAYACLPLATHTLSRPQNYSKAATAATAAPAASFLPTNRPEPVWNASLHADRHRFIHTHGARLLPARMGPPREALNSSLKVNLRKLQVALCWALRNLSLVSRM